VNVSEDVRMAVSLFYNVIVSKPRHNLPLDRKIAELKQRSPLDLSKLQLTDNDMEIVVTKAIIGKQCTWLRIEKNTITSDGASILANMFQKKNSLEGLGLFGNHLSDIGVQYLTTALSSNRNLVKALGLGGNGITDLGAGYLAEMLKTNRTVIQLWLQKSNITDQGIRLLLDVMETRSTSMQELDLSDNTLVSDSSVDSLCSLIQHTVLLRRLWVYGCNLSSKGKEQLLKTKPTQKDFDLRV
jgi:Ran GTPase-activating protein (RanGAP) involved in mRNA processing and transport